MTSRFGRADTLGLVDGLKTLKQLGVTAEQFDQELSSLHRTIDIKMLIADEKRPALTHANK